MQTSQSIQQTWDDYYQGNSGDTALKDRNFFTLETDAILEAIKAYAETVQGKQIFIVELGSGLGALAEKIEAKLSELSKVDFRYEGYDFSEPAVLRSEERNLKNSRFFQKDFFSAIESLDTPPDLIVTQRSIMALMSEAEQEKLLIAIRGAIKASGQAILSEGSSQALQQLSSLRKMVRLKDEFEKVWHSRYLDEAMLTRVFGTSLEIKDFSSLYWLITRVVYPFFETPKHNSPIHDFASQLPAVGNFGLVKLFIYRK